MNSKNFIEQKVKEIKDKVENEKALLALSGGVDSSVVAIIVHKALDKNLISYFIDDYFRKKDEYKFVKDIFMPLGINVNLCDKREEMVKSLEGISDNTQKRFIFRKIFYKTLGELLQENNIKYLLQGTVQSDKEMLTRGQEQHNVGVQFQKYGIRDIIEPLSDLYKPQIREIARFLKLPKKISERQSFPGPGLIIRCLGEITREKIEIIREAQYITEQELSYLNPFQVVVSISGDLVASMRERAIPDKYMLIVRAVKSKDAMTAKAIFPSRKLKNRLEERLMNISNKIGRILWGFTDKPPATIEYI